MKIPKYTLKIETMRGTGPGGQHRNKTDSAVRITHMPTGITAYADERSQAVSKRMAMRELAVRIKEVNRAALAARKKQRRDAKVRNAERAIRTYDYKTGIVRDHRSGKIASIKDVLGKGKLHLLR